MTETEQLQFGDPDAGRLPAREAEPLAYVAEQMAVGFRKLGWTGSVADLVPHIGYSQKSVDDWWEDRP